MEILGLQKVLRALVDCGGLEDGQMAFKQCGALTDLLRQRFRSKDIVNDKSFDKIELLSQGRNN